MKLSRVPVLAAGLAILACVLPLLLGFILPAGLLLKMALTEGDAQFGERFLTLSRNSFVLAGATAAIGVQLALLLAYGARLAKNGLASGLNPPRCPGKGIEGPCPHRCRPGRACHSATGTRRRRD